MRRCGLLRLGLHVLAAVDGVDLAGDEPGVGVGEELDDPGDLVGFTEAPGGNLGDDLLKSRLGYGGAYFDAFFPRLRPDCPVVAIGFAEQLVDAVPVGPSDRRVGVVVTDGEVVRPTPDDPLL